MLPSSIIARGMPRLAAGLTQRAGTPGVPARCEGVELGQERQRVVIRKPTMAMPKPATMFHEAQSLTGKAPSLM